MYALGEMAFAQLAASALLVAPVHAVSPGELDADINYLRADGDQHWTREPHETEQEFRERAYGEVKRNPCGIAMLFTFD